MVLDMSLCVSSTMKFVYNGNNKYDKAQISDMA